MELSLSKDVLELNNTNNLSRMNTMTKRQVCGIIELLKYKYAKEDLLTALILTKKSLLINQAI